MKKVICSLLLITLLATAGSVLAQRAPYWVKGEVVSIDQGPENSTVGIKMYNGEIFTVAGKNDKFQNVKVGDRITVKTLKGWAKSVTRN